MLGAQREEHARPAGDPEHTMGEPSIRWGVSYETQAWENRGHFGQGSRQTNKGLHDHRIPELQSLEAGVKGPQLYTEKDGF